MMDGHLVVRGKRVAVGSDPDLLLRLSALLRTLGAEIVASVSSTDIDPPADVPECDRIIVGDLSDLEDSAQRERADLLVTHSHGRRAAQRLGIPLLRVGFPIFDRLGVQHRRSVGYVGTREVICELANTILSNVHEPTPLDFAMGAQGGKDDSHGHELS